MPNLSNKKKKPSYLVKFEILDKDGELFPRSSIKYEFGDLTKETKLEIKKELIDMANQLDDFI